MVLFHLIYDAGLRGPSDDKPLVVTCCRLGYDVEVHVINFLAMQTSTSVSSVLSKLHGTNLMRDAAIILGGEVSLTD